MDSTITKTAFAVAILLLSFAAVDAFVDHNDGLGFLSEEHAQYSSRFEDNLIITLLPGLILLFYALGWQNPLKILFAVIRYYCGWNSSSSGRISNQLNPIIISGL